MLKEVWALRNVNGKLVPPMDDDETDGFMAWPSREEAEKGLKHQKESWDLDDAEVVRVA